jgi:mRNA interferase MazF
VKRGTIVVVAARGAHTGKPRPALVVQSNLFNPTHSSITICPITSDCLDASLFRLTLPPGSRTGLKSVSQVMIDKTVSVPRALISEEIGECDPRELESVDGGLRRWLALE